MLDTYMTYILAGHHSKTPAGVGGGGVIRPVIRLNGNNSSLVVFSPCPLAPCLEKVERGRGVLCKMKHEHNTVNYFL